MEQVSLHVRTTEACEPQARALRREKPQDERSPETGEAPLTTTRSSPHAATKTQHGPKIINYTDFPDGPGFRLYLPMQKVWVQSLVREERCPARRCQQTKA